MCLEQWFLGDDVFHDEFFLSLDIVIVERQHSYFIFVFPVSIMVANLNQDNLVLIGISLK